MSPATMSQEKETRGSSSAVLLAKEKGNFSMPQRTLMWQVGSSAMMRRAGLYCHGKYASVLILSALEELLSSCRSKMAGYAAKEFSWCCLLQVSANFEADFSWRRGGRELSELPIVYLRLGS